ncbi:MerR family transcriptional regulator [Litoribacter populi]|uniref:MerR family transcriptional regulator n=1 Tax=Litoribacter populi TaxID=2598460 RepID=UPI00117CCE95|nr:MerR family transcriptional regulator [Litoribacter populi]
MSTYSIKDLEQLSGIKAHTLRIWEQRYSLLSPKRTDTNIRFYDDDDLKLILNVALLNENGYKISKIAKMGMEEMREEVYSLTKRTITHEDQIYALTISMVEMDEERFDKILSTNILKIGFEQTMIYIIYPFLAKIGILWQTGAINPSHEHFISNLVRQKLIVAIDGQMYRDSGKKWLLFLPEGELHEIGLLFAAYIIKSKGHKVIYLGQSTPNDDLLSVYKIHKPDFLLTIVTTSPSSEYVQDYVEALCDRFQKSQILLTGYQVLNQDLEVPENAKVFKHIRQIKELLEDLEAVGENK